MIKSGKVAKRHFSERARYLCIRGTGKEEKRRKMGDVRGSGQGESNGKGNKGSGNKTLIIVIVILVIIAILGGVIIYLLVSRKNEEQAAQEPSATVTSEEGQRDVLVTEENVRQVVEQLEQEEYVPQGYYTVTQNYEWHFPKGNEASTDAHVENLPENTNDVYFDLFLADDQENPIYQSPVIPLGAVLEGFKLDKALDAGTYDCILVYHLVDENQKTISTVSMTVKVIIEG
jgi:hypothetical protein